MLSIYADVIERENDIYKVTESHCDCDILCLLQQPVLRSTLPTDYLVVGDITPQCVQQDFKFVPGVIGRENNIYKLMESYCDSDILRLLRQPVLRSTLPTDYLVVGDITPQCVQQDKR
ncbi:uncharacterized protein ZBAI_01509 [Zygosaccharomyces bailii ISA1307]|nr:uncharacterized protein ZBAI_01509 [Zygosaccharomyces bailii ISA1307]